MLTLPRIAARPRLRLPRLTAERIALAIVLLAGAALRLYDLEGFPSGIHGDETGYGLVSAAIRDGSGPGPFGTAFLGNRALFFFQQVPFLALFGQTLTALRLFSALAGVATLPVFYLLMRRMFGVLPAIVALALLSGSAVHVNFSRLGLELSELALMWCLTLFALWNAQQARRAFWWLLTGMLAGLSVYVGFGGALVPAAVALYIAYLLLMRHCEWRRVLVGSGLTMLGGAMALAPVIVSGWGRHDQYATHLWTRFIFGNWQYVSATVRADSVGDVLLAQLRTNLLVFYGRGDASPFYSFAATPLLAAVLGPLVAIGLLLMLLRCNDRRYALLAIWFWTTLIVAGVLTTDSPAAHRLLPAVLAALAAAALGVGWLVAAGSLLLGSTLRPLLIGAALLVPLLAGYADITNYFGPVGRTKPWELTTAQAKYVAALGPSYRVYALGAPAIYFEHSSTAFLAPQVEGANLLNPGTQLPPAVSADRELAFLNYALAPGYLPLFQSLYPNGRSEIVQGRLGPMFTAWLVTRDEVARGQGLTARYREATRVEADPGALGGGATRYPAAAEWAGSLYIRQQGRYVLQAVGAPAEILVDGASLGSRGERSLVTGWHALQLRGDLSGPETRIALRWREPSGREGIVPLERLWYEDVSGNLRGRVMASGGQVVERNDRAIGFRSLAELVDVPRPATVVWDGTLKILRPGRYAFSLNSGDQAEVLLDGRPLISVAAAGQSPAQTFDLSAGEHPITVRLIWQRYPGILELRWAPPGEETAIVPPEAFGPPP